MNRAMALALLAATVVGRARALLAQDTSAIRVAAQLAAEGNSDSARALLNGVLAHTRPADPSYAQALYWRARASTYADSAERDLRRVALEFSTSAWADSALLQLSQLALAAGNPASSFELASRLRSDYPTSGLRPAAALWGGRAAFEVGQPRTACALLDTARAEGAADVEFMNQVTFYRSRCTAQLLAPPPAQQARPDTTRGSTGAAATALQPTPATPAGAIAAPPPAQRESVATQRYEVQAAAASSEAAARDAIRKLTRAGLHARALAGGRYRRVRVGPFASRAEADAALRTVRRVLGGSPFVVRVP